MRGTHTRAKTLRAVDRNVREAIVWIITARPGLEQVDAAMAALTPQRRQASMRMTTAACGTPQQM